MSDAFQSLIPMTNWSYPAAQPASQWPAAFADLPAPAKAVFHDENTAADLRDIAIEEWRTALSQ